MTNILMKNKDLEFEQIAQEIAIMLKKKNEDYGNASFELGIKGVYVHLFDKLKRLENMVWKDNKPNYESTLDTLYDIAGYSIIGILIQRLASEKVAEKIKFEGERLNE